MFDLRVVTPYRLADVLLYGSYINKDTFRVTILIDHGPFNLPVYHPAVRFMATQPNDEYMHLAFDAYAHGKCWFGFRDYFDAFTFTVDGSDYQASSIRRLLHCFAPKDRRDISRTLRTLTERHVLAGQTDDTEDDFAVEASYMVDAVHLERELWKLLQDFLDAGQP